MQRRLVTVILFAMLAALVASTVLYKTISANPQKPVSAAAQILVAARDLDPGSVITNADLTTAPWGSPVVPQWISHRDDVVGRTVLVNVSKGEPFAASRLAAKGSGSGLAGSIPQGMRAVAVHVDDISGLSRYILPGMRVDVLSTGQSPGGVGTATRTILQNITVLSSAQGRPGSTESTPNAPVVLEVTPEQAEMLGQALETRIQLVLRNPADTNTVSTPGASAHLLLGEPAPRSAERPRENLRPAPAPANPPEHLTAKAGDTLKSEPPSVEIIYGNKRVTDVVRVNEPPPQTTPREESLK